MCPAELLISPEQGPVSRDGRIGSLPGQQGSGVDAEQRGGQCRIGQVVLG